jgi:hypothetical protein
MAGPVARTLTILAGLYCLFQFAPFEPRLLAPCLGLALAISVLTIIVTRSRAQHDPRVGLWLLMIGVASGVTLASGQSIFVQSSLPISALLPVILAGSAALAIGVPGRRASVAFAVLLATYAVIAVGDLALFEVQGDVKLLLQGGLDATLAGHSPYDITIANPFNEEETATFYGPGAVVNGRVQFGYPYLPVPLVLDIPFHRLGDARWMHLVAIVGAGAIAWTISTDRIGRAASVLLVINPLTTTVLIAYWVEPVLILLLTATVWAMLRGNRWAGVLLGLFFASKQYAFAYLPALWSVARGSGWRAVWTAAVVGGVIVGTFALWNPGAFVHSAIEFQFMQPFRDDSMSLLPGLTDLVGPIPEWLLMLSPVLGLLVSLLIALRTRPGVTAFALGIGFSLMFMVLLSKQAFMNYYFLMGAAMLLAVITWPRDNPIPDPKA